MAVNGNLPLDESTESLQLLPATVALEETYDATISSSTEVTLNASTKLIRVVAGGEAVMLKWGGDNATTSDFDHVIPNGAIVDLVVPPSITAVNVIERATTAWVAIIEF